MFESDSADMCAGKFPLVSLGGRAEGLACADPGARTPIGASENLFDIFVENCTRLYEEEERNHFCHRINASLIQMP